MNRLLIFALLFTTASVLAQERRHVIYFKDKVSTPFSTDDPIKFLSQKSIDRRIKQNILIVEQDFPVNQNYVVGLTNLGAVVLATSRWLNCALVEADDIELSSIESEPYVLSIEYVAPLQSTMGGRIKKILDTNESSADLENFEQLSMIGLDDMHEDGFDGSGITIGVFDSGYEGTDLTTAFALLRDENRITDTFDFVGYSDNVFQYDSHGNDVLSIMAADLDMTYRGGAYKANYQLYVTEDVGSEYRVEEYNWLFAAERADSAGVDIINSSLGYNLFDDASMDYSLDQVNGETAIVSKAAAIALSKGILVVVSAGNDGGNSWNIINPPADADGVLAVGAVSSTGILANFSSVGPTADGRLKPDVVALGTSVSIVKSTGSLGVQSGTSDSTPLITSLAAGVLQAFPDLTASQLYNVIINSGSIVQAPDNQRGYGVPHYIAIKALMGVISGVDERVANGLSIYPNPATHEINIETEEAVTDDLSVQVFDSYGKIHSSLETLIPNGANSASIDVSTLSRGLYIVRIQSDSKVVVLRFMKL